MSKKQIVPFLTKEQKNIVNNIKTACLTEEIVKSYLEQWGISWFSFKRRVRKSGIGKQFAYSWNDWLNKPKIHSKYNKNNLYFICLCGVECVILVYNFYKRKHQKPLCKNCYREKYCYDKEWREKNSKAQLISQNRPETLKKQRAAQKRRHAMPGMKEKYRKIGLKLWEDKNYRNKVIKNSSIAMNGIYRGITYQSSYELAFIMWSQQKGYKIKRFDLDGIPYKWNGKTHHYYPDFIINDNRIIEVKGKGGLYKRYKKLCEEKNKALKQWCIVNGYYDRLVFDTDLSKDLIKEARKWHKENSIGKIS